MNDVIFIYPVHNRLYYNQITLPVILHEAMTCERVRKLYIIDDMSEDGTSLFIRDLLRDERYSEKVVYERVPVGNSVDQWNMATRLAEGLGGINYLINVCNDNLIPFGLVDELAGVMDEDPEIMSAWFHIGRDYNDQRKMKEYYPAIVPELKNLIDVTHIGCGMLRLSVLRDNGGLDVHGRYFGFTDFQHRMKEYLRLRAVMCEHINVVRLDTHPAWSRLNDYTAVGYGRNIRGEFQGVFC